MKRWLLAFLLLVLGFAAPMRAQAQDACVHDPTIASLRECVQHAAHEGHIDNEGIARSLIAKLDAAQSALDRGQPRVAVQLLEAFVSEVRSQSGAHILPEHADHLLLHAQEVLQALGA